MIDEPFHDRPVAHESVNARPMTQSRVLIVGAGPSGLYQAFQLGLLGVDSTLVDALPHLGGQCSELYADKPIYDVPAIVRLSGEELAQRLWAQCKVFEPELLLGTSVESIEGTVGTGFRVGFADRSTRNFAAIILAGGLGAFAPRKLRIEGADAWEGRHLNYGLSASELKELSGKQVVLSGAGERGLSLLAQILQLPARLAPASLKLVHRSEWAPSTGPQAVARSEAIASGRLSAVHGSIVALHGSADPAPESTASPAQESSQALIALSVRLRAPERSGEVIRLAVDRLVVCHGLSPRISPLLYADLGLQHGQVPVDSARMESSRKGIFVVGDLADYPGKQKLIVCGFHEATLAAYAVCDYIFPGKKIHLQYTTTSPRLRELLDAFHAG